MTSFEDVWKRIISLEGESFYQIRGNEFKYSISKGSVIPDRTRQKIPKSNFKKAYDLVPLENTVRLQCFRGPSYIYAILIDERVRNGDW